jgi:hypothetical protein
MRKQLKMKVSDSRKIQIIALPQEAVLKAVLSDDQSETKPVRPDCGSE